MSYTIITVISFGSFFDNFHLSGFEERAQQVHSEDTDSEHYIPEVFMSVECPPYTDPPPPYSPPKPPQILPGEQPPPYEELSQSADANGNSGHENRNQGTLSSTQGRDHEHLHRGVHPLAEQRVSDTRGSQEARSGQQNTSMYTHCRNGQWPHSSIALETVQLELQAAPYRPVRANDYGMEAREETDPRTSSRDCVEYGLPAYAGTDIVGCVGVVLSPEEVQASFSAPMCPLARVQEMGQPERMSARRNTDNVPPSARENFETNSRRRQRQCLARGSGYTAQTLPATTAFQRFSNLFKRNSWRAKNRRRLQNSCRSRGMSEIHPSISPAQYSTVPGSEYRPSPASSLYAGFDLSACNFYPTTASPSTSSSNSSSGGEQIAPQPTHPLDNSYSAHDQSHYEGSSSSQHCNLNSNLGTSRRDADDCGNRKPIPFNNSHISSYHRQQFQNDLRRHLPPLSRQSGNFSSAQSSDMREISSRPQTYHDQMRHRESDTRSLSSPPRDLAGSPQELTSGRIHLVSQEGRHRGHAHGSSTNQQIFPLSSTQTQPTAPDPQRSLALLICSNLPIATAANSNQPCTSSHCDLSDVVDSSRNNDSTNEVFVHQPSDINEDTSSGCVSREEGLTDAVLGLGTQSDHHNLTAGGSLDLPCLQQNAGQSAKPTSSTKFSGVDVSRDNNAIRRSYSDTSEGSAFSVCSETGEQKLKSTKLMDADNNTDGEASVLPADCPYPQHHRLIPGKGSLPVSKRNAVVFSVGGVHGCASSQKKITAPVSWSSLDKVQFGARGGCSNLTDYLTQLKKPFHGVPEPESLKDLDLNKIKNPSSQNDFIAKGKAVCSDDSSNVNYNLNISPLTRKRLASKDLLPVVGENRMVKSVNLPPLDTISCSLSSSKTEQEVHKTSDHTLFDLEGVASARNTPGRVADMSKKRRKKSNVCGSSGQITYYHGGAKQKGPVLSSTVKEKLAASPKASDRSPICSVDSKSEKSSKRKIQQEIFHPAHPQFSSDSDNHLMIQSAGEPSLIFGNADVYRGRVHPKVGAALMLEQSQANSTEGSAIDNGQQINSGVDSSTLLGMNDLNQPPRKLNGIYDSDKYKDGVSTNGFSSHYPGPNEAVIQQLRRRSGPYYQHHRRQISAGTSDKGVGQAVSPSRRKPRPKSLAAPREIDQTHIKNVTTSAIAPLQPNAEQGLQRGRARSGFGHDMNLDNEYGMADFHIDSTNQSKGNLGYAAIVGTALPLKQTWRAGAVSSLSGCGAGRVAQPSTFSTNTNSKSGPCKDLSFVGRSGTGKARGSGGHRNRKRQSLPSFNPGSTEPANGLGQIPVAESENFPSNGIRKQVLGQARFSGLARTLSEEDVREATSYV